MLSLKRRWWALGCYRVETRRLLMSHLVIRPATPADVSAIDRCNRLSLPENYDDAFYMNFISKWPALTLVAVPSSGTEVLGYSLCQLQESSFSRNGFITSIAVLPAFRNLGIGGMLMNNTHRVLFETFEATAVSLHCRPSNVSAVRFYKSIEYIENVYIPLYYMDGEAAWLLTKKLP